MTNLLSLRSSVGATKLRNSNIDTDNNLLKLLSIFPAEIWSMILDNLSDSTSIETFCTMFPYLEYLPGNKLTITLFPKVWPILQKSGYLKISPSDFVRKNIPRKWFLVKLCKTTQQPRMVTNEHYLLKLRLVCKVWNNAIDNNSNAAAFDYKSLEDTNLQNYSAWEDTELNIWNAKSCLHHLSTMPNQIKNPFIGRTLHLTLENHGYDQEGVQYMELVLHKYGHHFWYCSIYVRQDEICPKDYIKRFCGWLKCLPNLKGLRIVHKSAIVASNPAWEKNYSREVNKQFIELDGKSFNNLEFLEVTNLPHFMLEFLTSIYSGITTLMVKRELNVYHRNSGRQGLSNFRRLSIKLSLVPGRNST